MIERTLVLVKPDGVYRALIGKVISTFEDAGLKVIGIKMVQPDEDIAGKHYVADEEWLLSIGRKTKESYREKGQEIKETEMEIGQRVRNSLLKYLTSGPVAAIVLEGNSSIYIVRKLIGATEPRKADPYSIRGRFGADSYDMGDAKNRSIRNVVHASEDEKSAKREIALWFKNEELVSYKRVDEEYLY
jgi:nucleoside-diphosphate kinase